MGIVNNPKFPQCAICKTGILLGKKIYIFLKPGSDHPQQICEMCFHIADSKGWKQISGKN